MDNSQQSPRKTSPRRQKVNFDFKLLPNGKRVAIREPWPLSDEADGNDRSSSSSSDSEERPFAKHNHRGPRPYPRHKKRPRAEAISELDLDSDKDGSGDDEAVAPLPPPAKRQRALDAAEKDDAPPAGVPKPAGIFGSLAQAFASLPLAKPAPSKWKRKVLPDGRISAAVGTEDSRSSVERAAHRPISLHLSDNDEPAAPEKPAADDSDDEGFKLFIPETRTQLALGSRPVLPTSDGSLMSAALPIDVSPIKARPVPRGAKDREFHADAAGQPDIAALWLQDARIVLQESIRQLLLSFRVAADAIQTNYGNRTPSAERRLSRMIRAYFSLLATLCTLQTMTHFGPAFFDFTAALDDTGLIEAIQASAALGEHDDLPAETLTAAIDKTGLLFKAICASVDHANALLEMPLVPKKVPPVHASMIVPVIVRLMRIAATLIVACLQTW